MSNQFGMWLRLRRKEASLPQRELARLAAIDFTYLSKVENGHMPPPSADLLTRLGSILCIDIGTMFRQAGKIPPEVQEAFERGISDETYRQITDALQRDRVRQRTESSNL